MPFGLGRKGQSEVHFITDITDKDELEEIRKIANRLDQDEKVLFVAKQSRMKPGGSVLATPNIVFATDKRVLIRNPTMLGGEDGQIDALPKDKAEQLFTTIRHGIDRTKRHDSLASTVTTISRQISFADELTKIAELKKQGIISQEEFTLMKQDLLNKMKE
jgi:hypothetical protein